VCVVAGRVLKVNISRPMKLGENNRAIWTVDRDGYDAIKGICVDFICLCKLFVSHRSV
jgi:hypothetical protein